MMEGFADLLTDAFSESSVPSFSTGDLDFENLCFDEKSEEEEQTENLMTETDEAQLQEASAKVAALLEGPTADALNVDENAYEEQIEEKNDEEDFRGVRFSSKTPEDNYCSSSDGEEEQKVFCSGRDEEEEAESPEEEGDALMSICSSDVLELKVEDGILDDEDSEILEEADELQVSNKLQEEVDGDEGEDGCRNEKTVKSAESEEEEQEVEEDSSESDYEGMKAEENLLSEVTEKPSTVDPADSGLEFPSISFQNLQDLISEVDGEVYEEKMSDFTGEEHQEAGESFADYPSDLSSGEHGRNPVNAQSASPRPREEECLERAVTESLWTYKSEEAGYGKEEELMFGRDIEMNAGKMTSLDEAAGEEDKRKFEHLLSVTSFDDEEKTSESDSYSSSDDEESLRRSNDVFSDKSRIQFLEDDSKLDKINLHGGSGSDDRRIGRDRYDPAEFLSSGLGVLETNTDLAEYLLTAEDTDGRESPPSGINQRLDEDVNSYSVVQREETKPASPFIHGSIDDSFFFNSEHNNLTEDGQQEEEEEEEDEYEERRSFEQMKQRIEAFKKFYDNSDDENGREERQIKVQFCADPLSQVNYYETDSSDRDSISSSSDREEDPSSGEQSDDREEDLNYLEQSDDREEDLNYLEQSDDRKEDLNYPEQSDDREEDLNYPEQSDDREEDLSPAEQSDDREEDLNYPEQSDDREEDLNYPEQSDDREEDLNYPEQSDDREEDLNYPEQSDDREEDLSPAEQSDDREEDLSPAEQSDDREEELSPAEQSDESKEPEEDLNIKPACDPPIVQEHQRPADIINTQTSTETRKSLSTLKMIVTLGVLTATGLMMFGLTTDQPDWLREFFFF